MLTRDDFARLLEQKTVLLTGAGDSIKTALAPRKPQLNRLSFCPLP